MVNGVKLAAGIVLTAGDALAILANFTPMMPTFGLILLELVILAVGILLIVDGARETRYHGI